VADEAPAITEEAERMLRAAPVVLLCGGLGPTHDDRTTEALADRFSRRLVVDEAGWERLRARYAQRGPPPEAHVEASARKMVLIPEGAEPLENPVGAASGYVLREMGGAIVVLPGVPAEMQAIFEQSVARRILPPATPDALVEVDVEMAEAAFAKPLAEVSREFGDVEIGSYPHFGERRVTLRFRGDAQRAARALEAFFDRLPEARARRVR
ncbi:MAG TPA: molybdopterin-binding protein, partial [Candidatus Thermoplasmatota archaeon]|nr:molybdopterin-binding protein [Candidatus Thermoplasmatota archaeon]